MNVTRYESEKIDSKPYPAFFLYSIQYDTFLFNIELTREQARLTYICLDEKIQCIYFSFDSIHRL